MTPYSVQGEGLINCGLPKPSFGKSERRLRLAPPSVSEAVASLERSLGGRLIERTSRRVQLTPFGAEFAAAIRQPIEALHQAHRTARLRSARSGDPPGVCVGPAQSPRGSGPGPTPRG
ncbi:LysR family transcriptional regulator [Streptomyces violaceusniger]|uniref:LysR family transcriptional regulator n=1 Tax=Streptomyces violaceusniger TaxID=68280 RepID=UPI003432B1F0